MTSVDATPPANGDIAIRVATSLEGRVRNTSLPRSHALMPLTEALANAIQAVDDRFGDSLTDGKVLIFVERSRQYEFADSPAPGRQPLDTITGFTVRDNGTGFTQENFDSFCTLYSDRKASVGSRGVGRLTWLKAFDKTAIASSYRAPDQTILTRSFKFTTAGILQHTIVGADPDQPIETSVDLVGFKREYQTAAPKTTASIAKELLTECLWYFVRPGGAPRVYILDGDTTIDFDDLLEDFRSELSVSTDFLVKGESFELISRQVRGGNDSTPRLFWCAASRVVQNENLIGKIPGLHSRLADQDGPFTYVSFLTSQFLDRRVRSDRMDFDILPLSEGGLLADEVTMQDIRDAVLKIIAKDLKEVLEKSVQDGKEKIASFVSNKAPRYRPVLGQFDKLGLTVDPNGSERELELQLHRQLQELETEVLNDGHEVLSASKDPAAEDFQARLTEYLEKAEAVKMADLAAYVSRRKVVLDILERVISIGSDGRYVQEEVVHSLIMPMQKDSNEVMPDASNLWIIDEGLAFHEYLASDKPLNTLPLIETKSRLEPDIVSLKIFDEPILVAENQSPVLASIVIVEFKRPMRNDARTDDKNPIAQTLGYLQKVRDGKVRTRSGRPIPASDQIPGYCYIVADLTPTMIDRCVDAGLSPTQDGMGYFGFNPGRRAYIDVFSFDRLLRSANQRNRAFFDKLGLPSSNT